MKADKRILPAILAACLLPAAGMAAPKAGGVYEIADDLAGGNSASVNLAGGNLTLSGTLAQVAASTAGAAGLGVENGYFAAGISTPDASAGNLTAATLAGNKIALAWEPSPYEDVGQYRLYSDNGTGAINYGAPLAVFTSTETSFTTGVFASSAAYRFALRAVSGSGLEENNESALAYAASSATLAGLSAAIKVPQAGKRLSGNRVTIMAEPLGGSVRLKQILFQYKVSTETAWLNIPAAGVNHPNPATRAPYLVHWDVTALFQGGYDLRAVASDIDGVPDATPAAVVVALNAADPDINEAILPGGAVQKDQKVNNTVASTVQTAAEDLSQLAKIELPAGALTASTVTLSVTNGPSARPQLPAGLPFAGAIAEASLSNAQSQLANGHTAAVTLSYADADNDGVVDGTDVRTRTLRMYSARSLAGPWLPDLASTVDTTARTVTGHTSHFSFFALFATLAADLDTVAVYPVPFKPNDGSADTGVKYSAGDPNSGIIFDNLPASVEIKIYTVTGQQVAKVNSASSGGRLQWDVKTDSGKDVASGGYLAVISSPGVKTVVKKLVVLR